uniref:Uncharacterized protein n=1 Tax=Panagrolaimus sp. ES5 TaxID=591445 RepID=A0AC34FYD1_9BILA
MAPTKFEIPIAMCWKVSKEEIQKKFNNLGGLFKKTKLAEFSDVYYELIIISKEEENKVVISLGISTKELPFINAKFKISIASSNKFELIDERCLKPDKMYGKTICSYEEFFDPLNNYFIDGYIYLNLEAILKFEKEQQNICIHSEIKSPKNLGEFLWNRDDKDFDIFSGDGKTSLK